MRQKTINFLYSEKGINLRNELINVLATKIDSIGWKTIIKINKRLPIKIRSKTKSD